MRNLVGKPERSALWPSLQIRPFPCSESSRCSVEMSCLLKHDKAKLGLPELAGHVRTSGLLLRFCLGPEPNQGVITQPLAADTAADTGPTPYHPTAPAFGGFWLGEAGLTWKLTDSCQVGVRRPVGITLYRTMWTRSSGSAADPFVGGFENSNWSLSIELHFRLMVSRM